MPQLNAQMQAQATTPKELAQMLLEQLYSAMVATAPYARPASRSSPKTRPATPPRSPTLCCAPFAGQHQARTKQGGNFRFGYEGVRHGSSMHSRSPGMPKRSWQALTMCPRDRGIHTRRRPCSAFWCPPDPFYAGTRPAGRGAAPGCAPVRRTGRCWPRWARFARACSGRT